MDDSFDEGIKPLWEAFTDAMLTVANGAIWQARPDQINTALAIKSRVDHSPFDNDGLSNAKIENAKRRCLEIALLAMDEWERLETQSGIS